MSVCVSVCQSATSRCSIKTVKQRRMITYDSSLCIQRPWSSNGINSNGAQNTHGTRKIATIKKLLVSTNNWLYLGNGTRYRYSFYKRWRGSRRLVYSARFVRLYGIITYAVTRTLHTFQKIMYIPYACVSIIRRYTFSRAFRLVSKMFWWTT